MLLSRVGSTLTSSENNYKKKKTTFPPSMSQHNVIVRRGIIINFQTPSWSGFEFEFELFFDRCQD